MSAELPHVRVPVDEARDRLVAAARRLPHEPVPLANVVGRIVAEPVIAPHDLPTHANSAMDGYAVAATSTGPWTVSAQILAGDDPAPLARGHRWGRRALRIQWRRQRDQRDRCRRASSGADEVARG
jgi:molybdopterin biosynthesis enzyme